METIIEYLCGIVMGDQTSSGILVVIVRLTCAFRLMATVVLMLMEHIIMSTGIGAMTGTIRNGHMMTWVVCTVLHIHTFALTYLIIITTMEQD